MTDPPNLWQNIVHVIVSGDRSDEYITIYTKMLSFSSLTLNQISQLHLIQAHQSRLQYENTD